jgi:hypothetical protein
MMGAAVAVVGVVVGVGVVLVVGVGGDGVPAGAADHPDSAPTSSSATTLGTVVIPNLGLGYTVTSQGPLNASQFASDAPNPSAAAGALSTLGRTIWTYERVWQAAGGLNQVQDLLVRFPNVVGATVFLQAAQHSLETGEIVSSDPLPSIPGARRVTYFAATNQDGVGEAITMRSGVYVDLLSIFSAASGNAHPISPADAERLAESQHAAMAAAPGGSTASPSGSTTTAGAKKSVSAGTIVLAVIAVAILAAAVATPGLLRRRRLAQEEAAAARGAPGGGSVPSRSAGDTVDDRGERSG